MDQFKFLAKDITLNKKAVSNAKATWFCENYQTVIIPGLKITREAIKNPIVKTIITIVIGAVEVVAAAICPKKK